MLELTKMTQSLPVITQATRNIIYIIVVIGAFLFFFGGAGESKSGTHTHSAFILPLNYVPSSKNNF